MFYLSTLALLAAGVWAKEIAVNEAVHEAEYASGKVHDSIMAAKAVSKYSSKLNVLLTLVPGHLEQC